MYLLKHSDFQTVLEIVRNAVEKSEIYIERKREYSDGAFTPIQGCQVLVTDKCQSEF